MDAFKTITNRHLELLAQQQSPPEGFLAVVQQFREDIFLSGREVLDPSERDQLRSILRFWTNYINQNSTEKIYETRDLDEFQVTPMARKIPSRWIWLVGLGLLAVLAVSIYLIWNSGEGHTQLFPPTGIPIMQTSTRDSSFLTAVAGNTQGAVNPTELTSVAAVSTTTEQAPSATSTPTPTLIGIVESSTPVAAFNVEFNSPTNGQSIPPVVTFQGTYTNLPAGWTIHLVFKPFSKGGVIFPWREAYTVRENEPDGNWEIPVDLGTQFDLSKPDEYVVDLVVAYSDSIRKELLSGAAQGLKSLPPDAFVVNKPVVVNREAYKVIHEERILYSAWLIDEQEQELFSARLDGSDITRITYTPDSVEDAPSLSPDGKKIAFVDIGSKGGNSLWIMDSNGENRLMIYTDPRRKLEGPIFSPDGRYLAYSATEPDFPSPSGRTYWNIYVIDLKSAPLGKAEPLVLTNNEDLGGNFISNRWPSWLDDKSLIYSGWKQQNEFVYRINLETRAPLQFFGRITEGSKVYETPPIQMPVFFSDANLLAYNSFDRGLSEIYVAVWPDKKPLQLTKNQYRDEYPRWSPDGRTIIYESQPRENNEIWAIQIDGSNAHRIIGDDTFSAMWPYVGKMVAYLLIKP